MFQDREYLESLYKIAAPITIQYFMMNFLNMIDVMMIGQLGDAPVAAVGLGNQINFVLFLLLFGISSGASVFAAQYWGKKDTANIRKVLGVCLIASLLGGTIFAIVVFCMPGMALSIFSKDPEVIRLGSEYLKIAGLSGIGLAITSSYAAILRATQNVKLPMVATIIALSLNTVLNYCLIFGNFGFPRLGVEGAAIATAISRTLESLILIFLTYYRKTPAAASIRELASFDRAYLSNYFKISLPVIINELFWSLGITVYSVVYARIGTESIAAFNIALTIERLAFVFFIGIGHACAIMVGNQIGAEEEQKAYLYARRTLSFSAVGAVGMGIIIIAGSSGILSFYKISDTVYIYAKNILLFSAFSLWMKTINITLIIGILRSGGDTQFGMYLELLTIWLIGVPLALLGAFVWHLPVYLVYLLILAEELVKLVVGISRFTSRKWIHNLASSAQAGV